MGADGNYGNCIQNMNKLLNRTVQTKYFIVFWRPLLCKLNTPTVTSKYFWFPYQKDKATDKLRSVPLIIDLTLFRFVA